MADVQLNDQPNYLQMYTGAYQAGRQQAQQKGIQNALSMNATDPGGAQAALIQYGAIPEANALAQNSATQRQLAVRQAAGKQYAAGDSAGAQATAAAAGDFDTAAALSKMTDEQRNQAAHVADVTNRALAGLSQLPQQQRVAGLQKLAPFLLQQGVPQAALDDAAQSGLPDDYLKAHAASAMSVQEQVASHQKDAELQNTADENKAKNALAAAQQAETNRHNRTDETNSAITAGAAATNARTNSDKLKFMQNGGGLEPEDLDFYAQKYARDGTLPSLMGPSGTATKSQILARASQLQRGQGQTGADFATTVAGTKANAAALTSQTKTAAAVNAAEQTANQTGDLALKLAHQGGSGPSAALFNRPIQAIRGNFSDPQAAAFNNALGTFRDEYAKVVGGGGAPTDALRHDVDSRINGAMSVAELDRVIGTMKQEMKFRSQSQTDSQTGLKGQIRGGAPPGQGKPSLNDIFGH